MAAAHSIMSPFPLRGNLKSLFDNQLAWISGTITNMTALPVMKLFFGGLTYDLQSAAYQLGRLKCYGDKDVEIATSKEEGRDDLRLLQHKV